MMENNEEEQGMEIEALKSIFMDDMTIAQDGNRIKEAPQSAVCYEIVLSPLSECELRGEDLAVDGDFSAKLGVVFAHSREYPNKLPYVRCRSVTGIYEHECDKLTKKLLLLAEQELLGAPMIYDLVEVAKEWLRKRTKVIETVEESIEDVQKRLEVEAEERLKAMRETGTPVTKENFEQWAIAFDLEMKLKDSKMNESALRAEGLAQLTQQGAVVTSGRKWFEEKRSTNDEVVVVEDDDEEEDFVEEDDSEDEEIGITNEEDDSEEDD